MYRQQNTKNANNVDGQNVDDEIIKEQDAQEALINIGNEAGGGLDNPLNPGSNESNTSIADLNNDNSLMNMRSMILNQRKEIDQEKNDERGKQLVKHTQYKNKVYSEKKALNIRAKLNHPKKRHISKNNLINPENEIQEVDEDHYVEGKEPQANNSGNNTNPNGEKNRFLSFMNEYLKQQKAELEKDDEPLIDENADQKEEDLTQADESLAPVQGMDFAVEKLPEREKKGFGTKLRNWLSYYTGKTLGKIGGFFVWLGKGIGGLFSKGSGVFGGMQKGRAGSNRFRDRDHRDTIPGWDGEEFENMKGPDDQVNVDFRRVPEVWSYPIAEKGALGDDKDKSAKPRDPVISVYVSQSSREYTNADKGGSGHTGIGIEYSRYSARTGRWQRYNLRFGFNMAGGGGSVKAKKAVTDYNNATIPGILEDEANDVYTISRSYPAKPKQVSNVLRSAETYAERGGYNAYTRNSMSFAREMIVDVAKIKGAENVFAREDVSVQAGADRKMFRDASVAALYKADMENGFDNIREIQNLNYQHFGGPMVTRTEYERYKNSLKTFSVRSDMIDSSNMLGEKLLREEGATAGQIGTFTSVKWNDEDFDEADREKSASFKRFLIADRMLADLTQTMEGIPLQSERPEGLNKLIEELTGESLVGKMSKILPGIEDKNKYANESKQSDLVKARTLLSEMVKKLNTLLFKYYQNDKRINEKVLPIINVLNSSIASIDMIYQKTQAKDLEEEDRDLGDLKNSFSGQKYTFQHNGQQIRMSPSEYEAWIQVFKTPDRAMENAINYSNLMEEDQQAKASGRKLPENKQRDLNALKRYHKLVLDFERSHKYMMEKSDFNQQDVDYAFSLEKKERGENVTSDMFEQQAEDDKSIEKMKNPNTSASGIYQMMIMKGVFGGMKERFDKKFPDNENYDAADAAAWLSGDAVDCIRKNDFEMKSIIRGMKHSMKKPHMKDLRDSFSQLLTRWIFQLFRNANNKKVDNSVVAAVTDPKSAVMKETVKIIKEVWVDDLDILI